MTQKMAAFFPHRKTIHMTVEQLQGSQRGCKAGLQPARTISLLVPTTYFIQSNSSQTCWCILRHYKRLKMAKDERKLSLMRTRFTKTTPNVFQLASIDKPFLQSSSSLARNTSGALTQSTQTYRKLTCIL